MATATMTQPPSASDVLRDELPWLQAFARRLASPAEADDLVQDTWIAAWQHAPAHDSERPLRPWLARVLKNRAHNRRRADERRRSRDAAARLEPSAVADPDAELRRFEVLQVLMGLVAGLPETDRRIVTRRFADQQNATEIGKALGLAPATVRSRLRRALERLRVELDEHHGGRAAWAAVLAPLPAVGRVSLAVGAGTKVAVGVAVALAVGGGVAVATSGDGPREPAPAAAAVPTAVNPASPDEPESTDESTVPEAPASSEETKWQRLRREIRAANEAAAGSDEAEVDIEALAPVLDATSRLQNQVFAMCVADIGLRGDESLKIVSDVVGAPDLGTIVTDTRIEGEVTARDELLECLTESMYTLRGPAPPVALETEMSFQFGGSVPGRPKPRPVPEASQLEPEQRRAVEEHHRTLSPQLAACDEEDPGATGSATLRVTLDADGTVASARFVETTLDLGVVDCMAGRMIGQWQFEGLPEGTVLELNETLPIR